MHGLQFARGNYIVIMDADFSHHPKFIPLMIAKCREADYDIVTGTRYAPGGGVYGWDLKRKLTSKGANIFADTVLRPGSATSRAASACTSAPCSRSCSRAPTSAASRCRWPLAVTAKGKGFTIAEVPITFVDRLFGESKLGGEEIVEYAKGVMQLWMKV